MRSDSVVLEAFHFLWQIKGRDLVGLLPPPYRKCYYL